MQVGQEASTALALNKLVFYKVHERHQWRPATRQYETGVSVQWLYFTLWSLTASVYHLLNVQLSLLASHWLFMSAVWCWMGSLQCVYQYLFAERSCLLLQETRLMRAPRLNCTVNVSQTNQLKEAQKLCGTAELVIILPFTSHVVSRIFVNIEKLVRGA